MAKSFSFDFKIGAQLGAGFSAAFAAASNAMNKTGTDIKKMNAEQKALDVEMSKLQKDQRTLAQAYKNGTISENQYAAGKASLTAKIKEQIAAQEKLAAAITHSSNVSGAQSAIKQAFATGPVTGFKNAINGTTKSISGMVGKLSSIAALAATGFGLTSLVGGAMEAGESVYQLSTKLHISGAEASQLNRVLSLTGGDADSASKALMRMDKTFLSGGKSAEEMQQTLNGWGVVITDSEGKLLPVNEQLKNLAAGYKIAAKEGMEQEFVMSTLGTKGMELTKTLQNYDEASTQASKVKGIGLDVNQMHQMNLDAKLLGMQASQLQLALTSAFAPLASELIPKIVPKLQEMATWISQNKNQISTFAAEAVKMAALYKGTMMLAGGMKAVSTALKAARTAQGGFNAMALLNPYVAVAAAIIAAIYLIYTNWDSITKFMSETWTSLCSGLGSTWGSICSTISGAWAGTTNFFSSAWRSACDGVTSIWNGLTSILSAGWDLLKAGVVAYINLWLNMPQTILYAVGYIAGVISTLPGKIGIVVTAAGTWLAKLPEQCMSAGAEFVAAANIWLGETYNGVTTWLSSTVTVAGAWLMNLPAECITAGAEFMSSAESWASASYTSIITWISATVTETGTWLSNLPTECMEAGAAFVSSAESWASEAYNSIVNWISQIPTAISNYVSSAWDNAKASLSVGFSIGSGGSGEVAHNANGGIYNKGAFLTTFAENSAEAAIPLDGSPRAVGLWQRAGQILGFSKRETTTQSSTGSNEVGIKNDSIANIFHNTEENENIKEDKSYYATTENVTTNADYDNSKSQTSNDSYDNSKSDESNTAYDNSKIQATNDAYDNSAKQTTNADYDNSKSQTSNDLYDNSHSQTDENNSQIANNFSKNEYHAETMQPDVPMTPDGEHESIVSDTITKTEQNKSPIESNDSKNDSQQTSPISFGPIKIEINVTGNEIPEKIKKAVIEGCQQAQQSFEKKMQEYDRQRGRVSFE